MMRLRVIVGSAREGRVAKSVAEWARELASFIGYGGALSSHRSRTMVFRGRGDLMRAVHDHEPVVHHAATA